MSSLSSTPLCSLLDGLTVVPQSGGNVTLARSDGTVISCQPDGTLQSRPAGTAGPYELCMVTGSLATFHPDGVTAWRFAFSL